MAYQTGAVTAPSLAFPIPGFPLATGLSPRPPFVPRPIPGHPGHFELICPLTRRSLGAWAEPEVAELTRIIGHWPPPLAPADFARLAEGAIASSKQGVSHV